MMRTGAGVSSPKSAVVVTDHIRQLSYSPRMPLPTLPGRRHSDVEPTTLPTPPSSPPVNSPFRPSLDSRRRPGETMHRPTDPSRPPPGALTI